MIWYVYVGWVVLCLIAFFYLSTRKKYRDPSAAQNYEKTRNKLTLREIKEPETNVTEEVEGVHFDLGLLVGVFIVLIVGVSLLGTIADQISGAMNSTAINNSSMSSSAVGTIASVVPIFFIIAVIGTVIAMLAGFFRQAGMV